VSAQKTEALKEVLNTLIVNNVCYFVGLRRMFITKILQVVGMH